MNVAEQTSRGRRERHLDLVTDAYLRTLRDMPNPTRYRFACLSASDRGADIEPATEVE